MLPAAGDDDRLSGKAERARLVALQHALMKLINRSTPTATGSPPSSANPSEPQHHCGRS
jgi:hypothetical protein